MEDCIICDICIWICNRYSDAVFRDFFDLPGEIRGKTGQGRFTNQFLQRKSVRLHQKPGGRHFSTAHIIPKTKLGAKKKIMTVKV